MLLFPQGCRGHGGADHVYQLQGGLNGGCLPPSDNGGGNGRGVALLAVVIEDALELLLGPGVHHRVGRQGIARVHAHVEGRIGHVGKAPGSVVQLGGRYPQVQQNAVNSRNLQFLQNLGHAAEIGVDQGHPVPKGLQPLSRRRQSHRVPVNADQSSGGQLFRNMIGVARTAQGAVHINSVRPDIQSLNALVQEDGYMMKFAHSPIASKDANSFSGLRFSCSKVSNSAASQISA